MNLLRASLKLMRPTQWIKNGFVFMPLIFSSRLFVAEDVVRVIGMAMVFCLVSSGSYILNDYLDMEQDRAHPLKKNRPLARGDISPAAALTVMGILLAVVFALALAIKTPPSGFAILAGYLVMQLFYSLKLKDIVIVDVLTIAAGFLLRVLAGAVVLEVGVSSWLILCTFSVAIFLALGKRRHEVVMLSGNATNHRPVLKNYSVAFLDQLLQVATTSTFLFYCLYSVRSQASAGIESEKMMFTIPFVTYGIFRYLYLIYHKEDGGSPTALLLTDPPLLICAILWMVACVAIIYW
ncbi:MAG: decaprenyl-phosphate phosphoribosyltransferase [Desulfomonile tiedjei]|nr:decaprenyl-phosphate phosphoribosyltransferase [Desulfomonile tiedjei]